MMTRNFRIEKVELMRVGMRQEAQPGQVCGVAVGDQYLAGPLGPGAQDFNWVGQPLVGRTARNVEKVYDASGPEGKGYRVILSHPNFLCFSDELFGDRYSCGNRTYVGYPGPVVVTVREVRS